MFRAENAREMSLSLSGKCQPLTSSASDNRNHRLDETNKRVPNLSIDGEIDRLVKFRGKMMRKRSSVVRRTRLNSIVSKASLPGSAGRLECDCDAPSQTVESAIFSVFT